MRYEIRPLESYMSDPRLAACALEGAKAAEPLIASLKAGIARLMRYGMTEDEANASLARAFEPRERKPGARLRPQLRLVKG